MIVLACAEPAEPWTYPLDDVLRVNHLQAEGTHNSYHVATSDQEELAYTHAPLDVQLAEQGVRQFELDVQWDSTAEELLVFHIPFVDEGTTCATLAECLGDLRAWSDANPGHHPLIVLVEPKTPYDPSNEEAILAALDASIDATWPDRVLTPDAVQGAHPDLATALATDGWPTLGEVRGGLVLSLLDSEGWAEVYTSGGTSLAGRSMFCNQDPSSPVAGVILLDDPATDDIASAVDAGLIVRTRADTEFVLDPQRLEVALDSGAQAISTDVPEEISMPDGNPSRCNPRTAPAECTGEAIERL